MLKPQIIKSTICHPSATHSSLYLRAGNLSVYRYYSLGSKLKEKLQDVNESTKNVSKVMEKTEDLAHKAQNKANDIKENLYGHSEDAKSSLKEKGQEAKEKIKETGDEASSKAEEFKKKASKKVDEFNKNV
ncbi:hypothetical protein QEN19_003284 [Hanseniaspora menglaensis]